ncbi:MAG: N-acetyl-D-Glu racemase DgcA [Gemmatimonadota bacterium]
MPELRVAAESWAIAGSFRISRGAKTAAKVVVVELREGQWVGRGECVPYPRYGETVAGVMGAVEQLAGPLRQGLDRDGLQLLLPAGAARNAVDCALWELEARRAGTTVAALLGRPAPEPVVTAYTLSLDTPEKMGRAALAHAQRSLLKVKLSGDGDLERVAAIRENAPDPQLIVDANEGWSPEVVEEYAAALAAHGVALIEQPLPAGRDGALARMEHPVPLCADESCHTAADIDGLAERYEAVNLKLDKSGGLTEALRLLNRARAAGLEIMVGCMVGTSLSMAPAVLLAQGADYVDLDGPLLLARDRTPGLRYRGSVVEPPGPNLWG